MTSLDVQQLTVRGRTLRAEDVSFSVEAGQIAALFGRNRSGVRAVLRGVAGLEPATSGEVRVDDVPVSQQPTERRRVGLVQRDAALFPGTVRDNVLFGLKQQKWRKDDRERRVAEVLELVGMTGTERDRADDLAAGERARLALARAIAPRPMALLIDSPTWFVPEVDRARFRARLREVLQGLEIPVVIGTPDIEDAVGIADDLHVMHEGRIRQSGTVSRVLSGPSSIEVADLVGYVTLIRGEVSEGWILEPGVGAVQFPEGFPLSGTARAMAHPAAMLGVPEASGLGCGVAGPIERIRAIGPTHLLDLRIGERVISVRWEWDVDPPTEDEIIAIAATPATLRFFNEPSAPRPAIPTTTSEAGEESPVGGLPASAIAPVSGADSAGEEEVARGDTTDMTPPEEGSPPTAEQPLPPDTAMEGVNEPDVADGVEPVDGETPDSEELRGDIGEDQPDGDDHPAPDFETPDRDAPRFDTPGAAPPSPAPAPPRSAPPPDSMTQPADETPDESAMSPSGGDASDEVEGHRDDTVEALAPWLQVSKPPPRGQSEERDRHSDLHRGMPLD